MKMGAGIFWGMLLIVIGLGIVIRIVFNINFPLFKFIIAFFFIFIGIKILVGNFGMWHGKVDENTTIFSESRINGLQDNFKEYNVIFGNSIIDLRDIDLSKESKEIKVNTIFAGTEIKIDDKTPVRIKADAAFASADLPKGNSAVFGTTKYESETFSSDTNYLYIKADVVFGSIEVRSY